MVHRDQPVTASSAVRRTAAAAVVAAGHVPTVEVRREAASAVDPFVKYVVGLSDGAVVEAVRIPLERPGRFSVCVSSQVGCALGCTFCATGRLGLARNLEAWEIVEQVRVVRRRLPAAAAGAPPSRVHGVVFQGMGEPLANLDRVLQAIEVLSEPAALRIDARAITVCTAGLPQGIRRLAREAPQVRVGWSMGSAVATTRRALMPVARAHADDEVVDALVEHARVTGHAPMWAVTLLAGVNDGDDDARALAARAAAFRAATGRTPRISVIAYNPIGDGATPDPFARSPREGDFRAILAAAGLGSHRRYSGGGDVAAACGQLAATA
ncbi:MAG: radical SAM protein [Kofleriaceae bacterium]|nr:radical SAM protein [Myxococcales bacterium]MCB9564648.1 radical SAM protein [Kofleriaceae bacterium]MCB9573760.1 radical SAM protein [Kofleriaceae bacterium]